jgi:hypothetical protein
MITSPLLFERENLRHGWRWLLCGWTLLFASFFAVIGLFRFLPWAEWRSGFWFLGLAAGVSLILRGWSYVMFALAIYNLILLSSIMQAA